MDSHRFDRLATVLASHLTRRASLGFFAATLSGILSSGEDAEAKKRKKKRKKRKKKRGQGLVPGQDPEPEPEPETCLELGVSCLGELTACCAGLQCDLTVVADVPGAFCCQPEGTPCASTSYKSCCSGTCDTLVNGGTCAPCRGRACSATRPCCGGETCTSNYCGGCRDRATSCTSPSQCCFSDCTGGACLSNMGGPCARDVDCRACYTSLNGVNCPGACVGGTCTV